MSERGGLESGVEIAISEIQESSGVSGMTGDGGYIRESQSATELTLPGMCLTVKVKLWRRTRHRTTIGT